MAQVEKKAERDRKQAERLREIDELLRLEEALVSVHRLDFPITVATQAPEPDPVDVAEIRARLEAEAGIPALVSEIERFGSPPKAAPIAPVDRAAVVAEQTQEALRAVPLIRVGERRAAKQRAAQVAEAESLAEEQRRLEAQAVQQQQLDKSWEEIESRRAQVAERADREAAEEASRRAEAHRAEEQRLAEQWSLLMQNDPATVLELLEAAFSDNEAPAAPIDCYQASVTVAMKFGSVDAVPESKPDVTPAGRPTIKKRSKTDRNDLYFRAMASNVLATVKEAFAVAPKIEEVAVLVIREETDGPAAGTLAAIYAGRFPRLAYEALSSPYPDSEIEAARAALVNRKGRTKEVAPLDIRDDPDLQTVLRTMADGLGLKALEPRSVKPKVQAHSSSKATREGGGRAKALSDALVSPDATRRSDALFEAGDRGVNRSLLKPLLQASEDPDATVRGQAFSLLSEIKSEALREVFLRGADDSDAQVRWQSVYALRDLGGPDMRRVFETALGDSDQGVRQVAAGGLRELGDPQSAAVFTDLAKDPDSDLRWEAIWALGELDPVGHTAQLIRALGDSDRTVRQAAATGLGEVNSIEAVEALAEAMHDEDADLRFSVVSALDKIGSARARQAIGQALRDPDPDVSELARNCTSDSRLGL